MSECLLTNIRRKLLIKFSRLKLKAIHRFESAASAVDEISAIQEGKLGKSLKKFLSSEIVDKGKAKESLAVIDSKLGVYICLYAPTCTHIRRIIRFFHLQKTRNKGAGGFVNS